MRFSDIEPRKRLYLGVGLVVLVVFSIWLGIRASSQSNPNPDTTVTTPEPPTSTITPAPFSPTTPPAGPECLTDACMQAADLFERSLNLDIDPCDDFYEFSCGKLIRTGSSPEFSVSPFMEAINAVIIDSLLLVQKNDNFVTRQLGCFFHSCMAVEKSTWIDSTRDTIASIGGWNAYSTEVMDWIDLATKLDERGFAQDHFLSVMKMPDIEDNGKTVIVLNHPNQNRLDLLQMDKKVILSYISKLNVDMNKKHLDELIALRNYLLNSASHVTLDSYTNKMTFAELATKLKKGKFEPLRLVQSLLRDPNIGAQQVVVVPDLPYLVKLSEKMQFISPRIISNYIKIMLVEQQLSHSLVAAMDPSMKPLHCFVEMQNNLGLSLGAAYSQAKMTSADRNSGFEMAKYIRDQIDLMIQNASWISEQNKIVANEKADSIGVNVAYLDMMMSDTQMEQYFSDLDVSKGDFFEKLLAIRKFENHQTNFGLPDKNIEIFSRATQVNAFYEPRANSINILPAIIQGRFFDSERPGYLNFGSLGSIIGHEFTHGFDTTGSRFDKDGNLRPWMDEQTLQNFQAGANCFVKQYDGQPIEGTKAKVNGTRTIGENIADNGGFEAAFKAYKSYTSQRGDQDRLPRLNLNQEQLFWVSLASLWCDDSPPSQVARKAAIDTHSPAKIRVNVPLSNQKEFSRVFNCPVGSRMNPEHKCELW